jgi:hypothetical protein
MADPVRITLCRARGPAVQQASLEAWLATSPARPRAVIAEGLFSELAAPADVVVARLAAGCVCCLGLVPLRVTLTRLLRSVRPREVLLLVAADEHLPRLRAQLASGELGPLGLVDADDASSLPRLRP